MRFLDFDPLCHPDIVVFLRYRVRYWIRYRSKYRDIRRSKQKTSISLTISITMSKAKTLTSGYKEIEAKTFDIAHDVPYLVRLGALATFQPRRRAPPPGPRPAWSSGRSVLLSDCLYAISCCPTPGRQPGPAGVPRRRGSYCRKLSET